MSAQTQPRAAKITFKSLLALPSRLCNPPPAVAKVRSCGVTPVFQVRLDDILERKHVPPLGLKDFEEWLLYCEDAAENLYFILWLKEYTVRYQQWTFFTPNAAYELNLPSVAFAPFHASNGSPHPDPVIFAGVALETRKMLDKSLARFVTAQFSNVGNQRALCGMIAGVVCFLIGALIPIVYNFALGHSRWLRLVSFPGMWLGLTILLAAFNGVCVGVQLRKFELSRPAISKPQPLNAPQSRPTISHPSIQPPVPPRLTMIIPPSPAHVRSAQSPSRMSVASSSSSFGSHSSSYSGETGAIHISPAYFDADDVDGPATSPVTPDNLVFAAHPPNKVDVKDADAIEDGGFTATAPFIHPFDQFPEDAHHDLFGGPPRTLPEERQILSAFDFDALPRCRYAHRVPTPRRAWGTVPQTLEAEAPHKTKSSFFSAKVLMGRLQSKCSPRWTAATVAGTRSAATAAAPHVTDPTQQRPDEKASPPQHPLNPSSGLPQPPPVRVVSDKHTVYKQQVKRVRAVPAFAVPLTPVLSSVVVRGQWEIVTRSAIIALLLCWVVLGSLLAVPPPKK
ncbi:hypothetical protein GGX14DRAFT_622225 [Mycena pura]|uniref:RGS domain-containing protein n=1 Tax=Mycena pura TaxID=153505 RepID=A0AAD6YED2_9AGAR|nr:hypothetical protein GGX14DRAFT_622225 [Mycena pura]